MTRHNSAPTPESAEQDDLIARHLLQGFVSGRMYLGPDTAQMWRYAQHSQPVHARGAEEEDSVNYTASLVDPQSGNCIKVNAVETASGEHPDIVTTYIPRGWSEFDAKNAGFSFRLGPNGEMRGYIPAGTRLGENDDYYLSQAAWAKSEAVAELNGMMAA
jgi:hypothetical protein